MRSKLLNFAIVGGGRIFPRHVNSIIGRTDVQLKLVCDIDKSKLEKVSKEFGVEGCPDYYELLKRSDIDVINICTPSGLHAEMAIAALKTGKHVIVEKPMALKVSDARRIISAAKRSKKRLCVVLQNRFNPPMKELKAHVEKGSLGQIYLAKVTVRWYRPQEYYDDGWHGTMKLDGGVLMNQAVHHIDALTWLMGMPRSVFCYKATLGHKMETEDTAVAVLKFPTKALACIEASTVCWPQNLEGSIALFGERGSFKVGGTALNKKVIHRIKDQEGGLIDELTDDKVDSASVYGDSHRAVIEEMIAAISEDREPSTSGREGIKSLQLVEALYESAQKNKEIFL